MTRLRRSLAPLAVAWLCCQVATVTFARPVFWFRSGVRGELECTCSHGGPETSCPMHHKDAGSRPCLIRSLDDTALLGSLVAPMGLLPAAAPLTVPTPRPTATIPDASPAIERPLPPDPPPPRA